MKQFLNPDRRTNSLLGHAAVSHCAAEADKRRAARRARLAEIMKQRLEEIKTSSKTRKR